MRNATLRLTYPALVLLTEDDGLGAPLRAMTTLLAQTLVADFGDAVVVVDLDDDGAGAEETRHGVGHVALRACAELDEVIVALCEVLPGLGRLAAYVFLNMSKRTREFQAELARRLVDVDLGGLAGRVVHLTRARAAPTLRGWSVLRTDLLAPRLEAAPAEGLRRSASTLRDLLSREMGRATGVSPEERGEKYPNTRVTPYFCRVRLDLEALGRMADPSIDALSAPLRASFARWARAITDRRVGVALGGSGSWGYAHVALLDALDRAGVPVDFIGSSSSGSLMGAYYAVLGRPGLELAAHRGPEFQRMATTSMLTSAAIEHRIDVDLGLLALEDLEILFFPVATNLTTASPEIITRSTVGFGVRASGTAPGFFAPTFAGNALYVDGAVTDNVPVRLLEHMGAALVIASNALPPPQGVRVDMPRSRARALLMALSPIGRMDDLISSLSLMLHDVGAVSTSTARVVFSPPGERLTIFRTFEFDKARKILAHVRREKEFREAVRASVAAWSLLRGPRQGDGE
jgi:NTE family protein